MPHLELLGFVSPPLLSPPPPVAVTPNSSTTFDCIQRHIEHSQPAEGGVSSAGACAPSPSTTYGPILAPVPVPLVPAPPPPSLLLRSIHKAASAGLTGPGDFGAVDTVGAPRPCAPLLEKSAPPQRFVSTLQSAGQADPAGPSTLPSSGLSFSQGQEFSMVSAAGVLQLRGLVVEAAARIVDSIAAAAQDVQLILEETAGGVCFVGAQNLKGLDEACGGSSVNLTTSECRALRSIIACEAGAKTSAEGTGTGDNMRSSCVGWVQLAEDCKGAVPQEGRGADAPHAYLRAEGALEAELRDVMGRLQQLAERYAEAGVPAEAVWGNRVDHASALCSAALLLQVPGYQDAGIPIPGYQVQDGMGYQVQDVMSLHRGLPIGPQQQKRLAGVAAEGDIQWSCLTLGELDTWHRCPSLSHGCCLLPFCFHSLCSRCCQWPALLGSWCLWSDGLSSSDTHSTIVFFLAKSKLSHRACTRLTGFATENLKHLLGILQS